jgi:hypothetical protein
VYRRVLCIVQEPEMIGRGGKGGGGGRVENINILKEK